MSRALPVSRLLAAVLIGLTARAVVAQAPPRPPLVEIHSRKTSDGYEVKVLVHEPSDSDGHNAPQPTRDRGQLQPAESGRQTQAAVPLATSNTTPGLSPTSQPRPPVDRAFEQLRSLPLTPAQLEQIRQVLLQTEPNAPSDLPAPPPVISDSGTWKAVPTDPAFPKHVPPQQTARQGSNEQFADQASRTTSASHAPVPDVQASQERFSQERFPVRPASATLPPIAATIPPAPATPSPDDSLTPRTLTTESAVGAESLLEAWQSALSHNQTLESLRWQTSAAVRSRQAAEAERWASASLHTAFHANNKPQGILAPAVPGFTSFPDSLNTHQRNSVEFGVHLKQPLYTFGRVQNSINAASMQTSSRRHAEQAASQDVMLTVARAYIEVLRAQKRRDVVFDNLASLREHENQVSDRYDQGLVVKNDLLAVRVEVLNYEQELLEARKNIDVANSAFNRAVGRPLDTPVNLRELDTGTVTADADFLAQVALQQRSELSQLNSQVHALRHEAATIRSENRPQVSLLAGYDYMQNRYAVNEDITSVGVVADWNFFDGGRKRYQASRVSEDSESLIRRRMDLEEEIALQVRQGWLNARSSMARVSVNYDSLQSAEENLSVSRNRYNNGTVTNTVVLDAVALRTASYGRYHDSVYSAALAELELRRAVGDLGNPEPITRSLTTP